MTNFKSLRINFAPILIAAVVAFSFQAPAVSAQGAQENAPVVKNSSSKYSNGSNAGSVGSTKILEAPVGKPVNILAMRDEYLRSNPGSQSMNLMKHRNYGFKFYADGRVDFHSQALSRVRIEPLKVSSSNGTETCAKATNSSTHSGVCITLTNVGGKLTAYYRFGNGRGGNFAARLLK